MIVKIRMCESATRYVRFQLFHSTEARMIGTARAKHRSSDQTIGSDVQRIVRCRTGKNKAHKEAVAQAEK
jgi:hypothetical protein